jgi:hypothetical protein
MLESWDLWFPDAGATGIAFARSRVDDQAAGNRLLVHAAPPKLEVAVRDQDGKPIAQGSGLERGQSGPMSYLVRQDDTILLEDGWPTPTTWGGWSSCPAGKPASSRPGGTPTTTANGAGRSSSTTTPDQ